jgi:hypothetical protein
VLELCRCLERRRRRNVSPATLTATDRPDRATLIEVEHVAEACGRVRRQSQMHPTGRLPGELAALALRDERGVQSSDGLDRRCRRGGLRG